MTSLDERIKARERWSTLLPDLIASWCARGEVVEAARVFSAAEELGHPTDRAYDALTSALARSVEVEEKT